MKIIKITITTLWFILVWLIGQDVGHYLFDKPTCESMYQNKPYPMVDIMYCYNNGKLLNKSKHNHGGLK